ncbi:MAG: lactate racemase domain-containing protein, partial [Candidatus Poribacteria bacterium]|nr:lactate racemase domain-containing protein [Candidatus Poribacteria bacterium]
MPDHPDRSHLIQYVENPNKRHLMFHGEGWLYEKFPLGTRVIYPPEPMPGIPDVRAAVEHAVEHPLAEPLSAQLKPGMKVTIVFDDISLTLPAMAKPDFRQVAMEVVLEKLGAAGIDDIHLIGAIGLHRRMTPAELRYMVGDKVFNRFHPTGQLYNHDAEDHDNLELLGRTDQGEHVELNKRAVTSDLVIYINLNLTSMDGGHKSMNTGITSYRSLYHHHNPDTLLATRSLMDPSNSHLHDSLTRMGRITNEHLNVFHIESTYNTATFPTLFPFLQKPEDDWSGVDRINFAVNRHAVGALPKRLRNKIFQGMRAPYGVTSVQAGATEPVHALTLENVYRQQMVPVSGQCDVLIAGTPYLGPYNVNSTLNPLLVHCLMLGYMFNMYKGQPLVREGGVLILAHPMDDPFRMDHHPSYKSLFDEVFPETTDPHEIFQKYEEPFATNPKWLDAYRNGYAFHGVHALYMWYWGVAGLKHLGKVIVLKPNGARGVENA